LFRSKIIYGNHLMSVVTEKRKLKLASNSRL